MKTEAIILFYVLTVVFVLLIYHVFEKLIDRCNDSMRKIDFFQVFVSIVAVLADIIFRFSFIYKAQCSGCSSMIPFSAIASMLFPILAPVVSC